MVDERILHAVCEELALKHGDLSVHRDGDDFQIYATDGTPGYWRLPSDGFPRYTRSK